jgi:hypothetical protein
VIEGEAAFARGSHTSAHTTHTNKALGLHSGAALRTVVRFSTVETECIARTWALITILVMVGEGVARRIVGLLLLLLMTSGVLSVLLCKDAEDTSGDRVMNDCLVVLVSDAGVMRSEQPEQEW